MSNLDSHANNKRVRINRTIDFPSSTAHPDRYLFAYLRAPGKLYRCGIYSFQAASSSGSDGEVRGMNIT